jgi:ribosomal protein S18 acetylase RimI-like enzyme
MFVYERGVDEEHQRRGIGGALVRALARLAVEGGCYGMWVDTAPENAAAIATYRSAEATRAEESTTLTWTFTNDRDV